MRQKSFSGHESRRSESDQNRWLGSAKTTTNRATKKSTKPQPLFALSLSSLPQLVGHWRQDLLMDSVHANLLDDTANVRSNAASEIPSYWPISGDPSNEHERNGIKIIGPAAKSNIASVKSIFRNQRKTGSDSSVKTNQGKRKRNKSKEEGREERGPFHVLSDNQQSFETEVGRVAK